MASLSYYGAFMFFLASTIASSALATSRYNINDLSCAETNISSALELYKKLSKSTMEIISNATLDFAANGKLEKLIISTSPNDKVALSALGSCRQLFLMAMDNLNNSLSGYDELMPDDDRQNSFYTDCFAGDNLEACKDGFNSSVSQIQDSVSLSLNSSIDAILKGREILYKVDRCYRSPVTYDGRTPSWISSEDEELIQNANIKPDIVVEQDGSGNYRTISEAIKAAPSYRKQRFYIYVKQGIYSEYVNIGMDKWNLVMFGDGMYKTIVTGSKSKNGGYDINNSGTFIVQGKRFIARDMGFVNTAGNSGEQAVALYATTDRSVFYRCQINGYQDTLYVNAGLQFYRECDIYGTIDFIFGNAAAVIQSSTILAKRPQQGRGNAIVAQGRTDSRCQTAIVIQSSTIKAAEDLSGVTTALGRPWKTCSAVVYLNNYMESLISPIGWTPMNPGTPPDTIFLAEYGNKGPGSNVAGRVNWKGVRTNLSYNEANRYTVNSLISGSKWLAKTRVPYNPGL